MAMRAIMKKISPINRLMYGIQRISCCCTSVKDRGDLNNEAVACGLENIRKDGFKVGMFYEWCMKVQSLRRVDIQQRWKIWVDLSNEVWEEKSEEEQKRELDLRWTYLKDLLHRHGVDTSHHRLLLSMKKVQPRLYEKKPARNLVGGTFEFVIGSPDKGLVSINRLVLDRGRSFLPAQSVNGLLFIINMDGAFLMYNPITGERSPWIEINRKPGKRNHIAFGFDPQSDEHKVIWISGSNEYHFRESILERPKDQVVEVLTVGKNTWRRIDATPPISITYEDSFYVDGCLYWRFRETEHGELEQIMRFDIVAEKFSVIPIPGFVIHPKEYKWSQTVDLTEIDGRIAVLTQTSLWTFHEEADGDIKWTEEKIHMPCDWNGKPELSIEALTGTDLILLRPEWSDSIFYFNRNTKKSIRFPISPNCSSWDWEKIIQV